MVYFSWLKLEIYEKRNCGFEWFVSLFYDELEEVDVIFELTFSIQSTSAKYFTVEMLFINSRGWLVHNSDVISNSAVYFCDPGLFELTFCSTILRQHAVVCGPLSNCKLQGSLCIFSCGPKLDCKMQNLLWRIKNNKKN